MESYSTLLLTAVTIGVIHTLAGPDHYLPFVVLSKSKNWGITKTINIVVLCGLGHVLSSIIVGFIGIAAGVGLSKLELFEGLRGNIAAWLLFSFGIAYTTWAVFRLIRKKTHSNTNPDPGNDRRKLTIWIVFIIFVFGPCEPLIPVLMYPAAQHNYVAIGFIALVFALATISTMIISVLVLLKGFTIVKLSALEKYQHVLTGSAIMLCGAGILCLGT
jgi:sulfite exporter TauE/SafE